MSKKFATIIPDKGLAYSRIWRSRSARLYFAGAVALALAFLVLSWLVFTNTLTGFDAAVEEAIASWNFKGLHTFFEFVADNTTLIASTVLAVIVLYSLKLPKAAAFVALAAVGGWAISLGLKFLFQRVRPGLDLSDNIFSYPSGHATVSICLFGSLIFISSGFNWSWRWSRWLMFIIYTGLISLVLAIGLSRIYFGHHYPTDVLAGWLVGGSYLLLLAACYRLLPFLADQQTELKNQPVDKNAN